MLYDEELDYSNFVFVYPNTTSTFTGDPRIAISNGYVAVTKEIYNDVLDGKMIWVNDELVEDPDYQQKAELKAEEAAKRQAKIAMLAEIADLKKNLSDTDYLAIKCAEGVLTKTEYAPTKALRKSWRERINELEALLNESEE